MHKNTNIKLAWSTNSGITFQSNLCPRLYVETFFDSSENIRSKMHLKNPNALQDDSESLKDEILKHWPLTIFNIILVCIAFVCAVYFNNFTFTISALMFSTFISYILFDCIEYWCSIKSKKGKYHSLGKIHAAEHMVINAYQTLHRIPKLEEVKKFSRFDKRCGSMQKFLWLLNSMTLGVFMPIIASFDIRTSILLTALYFMFMLIAIEYGWLIFLQILVTNKPSDRELLLAIEALTRFEIMEKKIANGKINFVTHK